MKILIVSEGKHELGEEGRQGALQILVHRLLGREQDIEFETDRVSNQKVHAFHGRKRGYFKRAIRWLLEARKRRVNGLVFLIDQDRDTERHEQLQRAQEWREPGDGFPRAMGVAVLRFDAWMLADETALNKVLQLQVQTQKDPEVIRDPKDACASLLEQSALDLTQTAMYAELANQLDILVLESRCPAGFAPFSRRVRSILAP